LTEQKTAEAAAANLAAAEAARRAQAEEEARRNAESARREAEANAQLAARRAQAEEEARRNADVARREAEANAQRAAQDAERAAADRAKAEAAQAEALAARNQADQARQQADQARQQAEAAKLQADSARAQAERDAQSARDVAAKAEAERTQMRERLQQQLNAVLETKQTARGLVANMEGVLFDTGKATLKPAAKEKLAKVSGILLSHPDLRLEIEGHTDNTGSDATNQRLSEARAEAARDYLVSQGLTASAVTAKGFGESMPIASNDSAAGRTRNRRVELVISGASIDRSGLAAPDADRRAPEVR
jgi:outer membrane protein OmpA-like peptidoglycan-associated protein